MRKPIYSIGLLFTFFLLTLGFTGSYAIRNTNDQIHALRQEIQELKAMQPVETASGENVLLPEENDNKSFVLKNDSGYITVYMENGSTVYEYTAIAVSELPKELQKELEDGKIIDTSDALYSFLENYSS